MKKVNLCCVTFCCLIFCLTARAQKAIKWGVKAGMNLSGSSLKENTDWFECDKEVKTGFQAGITAEYALSKAFFLQSGLSFTQKGVALKGKDTWIGGPVGYTYWKQTLHQNYLQLPVMAAYKKALTAGTRLFVQAGPYLAYGIGGKCVTKNVYENVNRQNDGSEVNTFDDNGFKRFDFGLTGGAGIEIGRIVIGLNYELGLTEVVNEIPNNNHSSYYQFPYKNRNASLTVGFKL